MLSELRLLSGWDWIDMISLGMVFLGALLGFIHSRRTFPKTEVVVDPAINDRKKEVWESARKNKEHFWEYVLIVGLGIELLMVPRHIKEVADLKNENLKLEAKLEELRKSRWEKLRDSTFSEEIKGKSGGCSVKIYCPKEDSEIRSLGKELFILLQLSDWKIAGFSPIPDDMVEDSFKSLPKNVRDSLPSVVRAANSEVGIILAQKADEHSPAYILWSALDKAGIFINLKSTISLPPDQIIVVIGSKL